MLNKCIFTGRLGKDPEVRYTQDSQMAIARFSLAIDKMDKEHTTGFINVVCFGKIGEFAEKYLKKGTKIELEAHVQPGSYQNKEGKTVYTYDFVAEKIDFAESKKASSDTTKSNTDGDNEGFSSIPDDMDDELPFE